MYDITKAILAPPNVATHLLLIGDERTTGIDVVYIQCGVTFCEWLGGLERQIDETGSSCARRRGDETAYSATDILAVP